MSNLAFADAVPKMPTEAEKARDRLKKARAEKRLEEKRTERAAKKKAKGTVTTKKVKAIGHKTFIDPDTGEMTVMEYTQVESTDFNFMKVWMTHFLATIDIIGDKKTKLCLWIIDHLNRDNQLCYSYRQIADMSGTCYQTVALTMKLLMDANFMRKDGTVYKVNPDIIFKGTHANRMNVLIEYNKLEKTEMTKEEKIANLKNSINQIQKQIERLGKE